MKIKFRVAGESDKETIRSLLNDAGLPVETVDAGPTQFFLATRGHEIVGVGGLELYGRDGLLRSVAVVRHLRGTTIGTHLVDFLIERAREQQIERMFLLTDTARMFFEKRGFGVVDRSTINNEGLLRSTEFASVCDSSATCMGLQL